LLGFPNLGSTLPNTLAVTVDDQFVYATSDYGMVRFPKTGPAASPKQLLTQMQMFSGIITTDGQYVYWSEGVSHDGFQDLIRAIDINGVGPIITVWSVDLASHPYPGGVVALAVEGNDIIFLEEVDRTPLNATGIRLWRIPKQGGTAEELFSTGDQWTVTVTAAAIGPDRVVFATFDTADPTRVRISAIPRQPPFQLSRLTQTSLSVRSIAFSGVHLWWTGQGGVAGGGLPEDNPSAAGFFGYARQLDMITGEGRTLSEDGARFGSVAADESNVYWMEDNKLLTVRR